MRADFTAESTSSAFAAAIVVSVCSVAGLTDSKYFPDVGFTNFLYTFSQSTYARQPVAFTHGEGSWVVDTEGKRYLDALSGIAVNTLGHAHPKLVAALQGGAAGSWALSHRAANMLNGHYPLGFKLSLHRKDLAIALAEATAAGLELPVSERVAALGKAGFLKCVAPDLKTFQAFVAELTAAPHVRNVKTSLTLRNSKDAAMVPMEQKGKN